MNCCVSTSSIDVCRCYDFYLTHFVCCLPYLFSSFVSTNLYLFLQSNQPKTYNIIMNLSLFGITLILFGNTRSISGTCECNEVCSTFKGPSICWTSEYTFCPNSSYDISSCDSLSCCPPGSNAGACIFPDSCEEHNSLGTSSCPGATYCPGTCACDIFGCNCSGCSGCTARRILEDIPCKDYDFYMSLTASAKIEHLQERYCDGSQVLNPAFFYALENAADANADGTLSCAEFDTAFDVDSKIDPKSIARCFSSIDSGTHKSAKKSKAAF